jgi:hypothetical protein
MGRCNSCGSSYTHSRSINICDPCNTNTGCAIQLDFECVIYHKSNNQVTNLTCLELSNGATLNQFAEAVDSYICQIKADEYQLPCLREDYTINTLEQFAEAVDSRLCELQSDLDDLSDELLVPLLVDDTDAINLVASGTTQQTISAHLIVAPLSDNQLTVLPTGVYVAPQTLSIDYDTLSLCISDGNCVDLSTLSCGVGGYLGEVATDPGAVLNGQYWYNTGDGKLKIKLNGTTRQILIV